MNGGSPVVDLGEVDEKTVAQSIISVFGLSDDEVCNQDARVQDAEHLDDTCRHRVKRVIVYTGEQLVLSTEGIF